MRTVKRRILDDRCWTLSALRHSESRRRRDPRVMVAAWILIVGCILLTAGCMRSREVQKTVGAIHELPLLGWVERSALQTSQYAWFDSGYAAYAPALDMLEDVQEKRDSIRLLIVFGTWCSDSRRELPRFFKILDGLNVPAEHVQLFGVDRTKKHPEGIPQQYDITLVPTIIVLHNGMEVGRIVESPKTTLELDLLEILGPLR